MNTMPSPEGDALSAFGWGLRRYAGLVLLCVVLVGVLLPTVVARTAVERYDSSAQVGPTTALKLPNLDALPRLGETTFDNGAVADAVRSELGLPESARVSPQYVELVAPQDNIVFTVVGHGANPDDAVNAANSAAGAFVLELNKYGNTVGEFTMQHAATPAAQRPSSFRGTVVVVFGAAAGFLLGLGLVALLLVVRRPVFTASGAARAAGAPVLASLVLDPVRDATLGLPRLCQRLRRDGATTVFLVGPHAQREDRVKLAADLTRALGWRSGDPYPNELGPPVESIRVIEDPVEAELAMRPPGSMTLLVLRVGTREETARLEAEYHLGLDDSGVVLLRHRHRLRLSGWRLPRPGRASAGEEAEHSAEDGDTAEDDVVRRTPG